MKFEYLYVVFFVLSLVYKWYKSSQQNAESSSNSEKDYSNANESYNTGESANSFEDLIAQFERAYGDEPVTNSAVENEKVEKPDEPLEVLKPKVEWYEEKTDVGSVKKESEFKKRNAQKSSEIIADKQPDVNSFDLRQMVISSAVLDRPYK